MRWRWILPENKNIIESLSGHANEYIRSLACAHPLRSPVLCAMLDFLALKGKGIDIGCGIGLPALAAAKKGLEVVGVDRDAKFVEMARLITRKLGMGDSPAFRTGGCGRP